MTRPQGSGNLGIEHLSGQEALLARFERAWQSGPPPRLEEFLPSAGAGRCQLLEELVAIDLEYRWSTKASGSRPWTLEDYVARFPELGPQLTLDLIVEEYQVRRRWGDRPSHTDYAVRFPQHGSKLAAELMQVDADQAAEFAQHGKAATQASIAHTVPHAIKTVAALVDELRQSPLLNRSQVDEISLQLLQRFTEPMTLAKELLKRGWLTPYQVNQLLQGRGRELMLGPYVLLERLGEGGAGQVFKARHLKMNRIVALKLIRQELLTDAAVVGRFYREIQIVSQLDHPNVVHAYDAGPVGVGHFLAMEFVEGTDLGRLVKQGGPLPVLQACEYIRQAASGLQHAHERGLVHRDIKPHNLIMSRQDALIKVADLGLARLPRSANEELTSGIASVKSTGTLTPENAVMIGTADYLAPEQALNFHAADVRADIYSLGCTFYYLLTGQSPVAGGTLAQKVAKHLQAEPPPLDKFRKDVPPVVEQVLQRMLAKRPEDRYQTPGELAMVLAGFVRHTEMHEKRAAGLGPVGARLRYSQLAGMLIPRRRILILCICCAVLLIGMVLLFLRSRSPLDSLDPKTIPIANRPPQPVEGLVAVLGEPGNPSASTLAFSPDSKLLAASGGHGVRAWNLESGEPRALSPLAVHRDSTSAVAFAPDSRTLASAGDTTVRIWDLSGERPSERMVIREHNQPVVSVAFAPTGKTLASASRDEGRVFIWDVSGSQPKRKADVPSGLINRIAFAPKGMTLATAEVAQRVRLFDLVGDEWKQRPFELLCGSEAQFVECDGPEGEIVAVSDGGGLTLWNVTGPQPRQLTPVGRTSVLFALAPSGKLLAAATPAGTLSFWQPLSGQKLKEISMPYPIQRLAFAPDGRHLAVSNANGTIYILRLPPALLKATS
jgi:serine/threonine protein kinase/WD40 repeat protein